MKMNKKMITLLEKIKLQVQQIGLGDEYSI